MVDEESVRLPGNSKLAGDGIGAQSRLVRDTSKALDVVVNDIKEVSSSVSRLKDWLTVPPEFRKS